MPIHTPIENAGLKYVNGLKLSHNSVTLLDVAAGECRESTNVNDIEVDALSINTAINGAGGLDQGSMANSTLYAVHAIGDSTKNNVGSAMLSLEVDEPLLPFGFDMNRRIGWVLTDGSAQILPFVQNGEGSSRRLTFDTLIEVLNAGTATAFTDVDCSAFVPETALAVVLQCVYTPNASGTNTLHLRRNGSSSAFGTTKVNGTATIPMEAQAWVPVDSAGIFEYFVTDAADAATIDLASFDDEL